jgi:hypothetical protein
MFRQSSQRLTMDSMMNPTPSKRRRSNSPSGAPGSEPRRSASPAKSTSTGNRHITASPQHHFLPPPLPSSSHGPPPSAGGSHPFPPFAGPSNWTSPTPWPSALKPHHVRHSMDIRSPSPISPREDDDMSLGITFTRDTSSRAPRSMMACTRCRRQKWVTLRYLVMSVLMS